MIEKKASQRAPIHSLIASRWSGRAYDESRTVSVENIHSLLEAARWAPSCFGDEPWRYIVTDKTVDLDSWEKALSCLSEGNQSWAKAAPVLILVCAHKQFSHNNKPNRWAEYDTGAATLSLVLQATDLGLMAHQMGGYDRDRAQELFHVPDDYGTIAVMAIGYQLNANELPNDLKERELSERKRNEPEQLFYKGDWGQPVSY